MVHRSRRPGTRLGELLGRQPAIGKLLALLMGLVEVTMLDLFNFIGARVSPHFKIRVMGSRLLKGKWGGRVIPLDVNIPAETVYLPTQEILSLVSRSNVFAIGECYCRKKHQRCDNPTGTCILLGPAGAKALVDIPYRTSEFKRVTKDRVLAVLQDADRRGLVHQAIFFPSPDYYYVICNCCTCCCEALHDFKRFGIPAVVKSDFIEGTDMSTCTGCGSCTGACPFDARRIVNGNTLVVNQQRCFGCGVCVGKCPEGAITLRKRKAAPVQQM